MMGVCCRKFTDTSDSGICVDYKMRIPTPDYFILMVANHSCVNCECFLATTRIYHDIKRKQITDD